MSENIISTVAKNSLVIVVGNRPQFIKLAPVVEELNKRELSYTVVHTGQHYDHQMSGVFFKELGIRKPDIQIQLNSRLHGAMTAEILEKLESIFLEITPKGILLFGDTNSTLAVCIILCHVRQRERTLQGKQIIIAIHLSLWFITGNIK